MTIITPPQAAPKIRFEALDGWRGLCALLVAMFHVRFAFIGYEFFLFRNAFLFVDFFFVLSGFVLMHTYGERLTNAPERLKFVIRRWGRLWPLHMATLMAMVALELVKLALVSSGSDAGSPPFTGDNAPDTILGNVLLIHGLGFPGESRWNYPSWSISCEFFAYLTLMLLVSFLPRHKAWAVSLASLSGFIVMASFVGTLGVTTSFSFARAVYGFFLGAATYLLWKRFFAGRQVSAGLALVMELTAIAIMLLAIALFPTGPISLFVPFAFAGTVLVFATAGGSVSRLLRSPPLQWLGKLSYSVYLLHAVILAWLYAALAFLANTLHLIKLDYGPLLAANGISRNLYLISNNPALSTLVVLAFIPVLLLASAWTYRLVEVPGQSMFNAIARRVTETPSKPQPRASDVAP